MNHLYQLCEGAMLGHALADNFGVPTDMAILLSESLRTLKRFDPSDVMSRYLYLHHTIPGHMGKATRLVYEELKASITPPPIVFTRNHFIFPHQKLIEASQSAHKKLNGLSAGCNPAQRSYPLAFSVWIDDDRLFEITCEEARLTHFSPQAGQVAGIVNLICRHLIRGENWDTAVKNAFTNAMNLSGDIKESLTRYNRDPVLNTRGHAAYATNALHTALHCVSTCPSFATALERAHELDPHYCLTLVGLLAGARWNIPPSILAQTHSDHLSTIRQAVKFCDDEWQNKSVKANGHQKWPFSKLFPRN